VLIEVKGVQFVNKGAELMLYAVIQQLQSRLPNAKLVLEPGTNSPFEKRMQVGALQKFSIKKGRFDLNSISYYIPKRVRSWLTKSFGIVMEADIDAVLEASGFAYGDQWPSIKITHLCNEILRANKNGKKYVLLPQAMGPFSRSEDAKRLKKALPNASLVCAREKSSYENIVNMVGERPNILQFGDFTNLVNPIVGERWQQYKNLMLIIPNYNMMSERNNNNKWKEHYLSMLTDSISLGIEKGLTPVILNHEGKEDAKVCALIQEKSGHKIEIFHEQDSRKVKGIISVAKLVVCSRFHGCVSALCQGVPCLGTSWSHKYERLFEEYSLDKCLLMPDFTKDELNSRMDYALEHSFALSDEARIKFKQDSSDMWDRVVTVLK